MPKMGGNHRVNDTPRALSIGYGHKSSDKGTLPTIKEVIPWTFVVKYPTSLVLEFANGEIWFATL